jgi:hypothetical protein
MLPFDSFRQTFRARPAALAKLSERSDRSANEIVALFLCGTNHRKRQ